MWRDSTMEINYLLINLLASIFFLLPLPIRSYIPAQPSNQTFYPNPSQNDSSWIVQLNWLPIGIFSDGINHQLTADSTNRSIYQGVLLHFSELNATTQPPAMVPWIAMINCDSNSTTFSSQDDIFTLARDRGAAAAMLYSSTSHSCLVNPEYIQKFEKPLDVFSAGSLQGARLIESQFSNILSAGYWFQSDLLNVSASTILQQIKSLGLSNLTSNLTSTTTLSSVAPIPTSTTQLDQTSLSSGTNDDQPLRRRSLIDYSSSYNSLHQSLVSRASHPSPDQAIHLKLNLNSSNHHPTGVNAGNNPVFLIATLANAQVTGNLDPQSQSRNPNSNFQSNPNGSNNNPNTGLAMVILYAITGCVSFMSFTHASSRFRFLLCIYAIACLPLPLLISSNLGRFLIVIVSGAIRAIRNPDRYGPRPGGRVDPHTGEEDPYAQPRQTRAAGLGKAILDTFPIVKFGHQDNSTNKEDPEPVKHDPTTTTTVNNNNNNNNKEEVKLALDESLHPGQENIHMVERIQRTEELSTTYPPFPIATATNTNTTTNDKTPDQDQYHDDDDNQHGSVVSETPYPLHVSRIPLLSELHLSSSSTPSPSPKKVKHDVESPLVSNNIDHVSNSIPQDCQLNEETSAKSLHLVSKTFDDNELSSAVVNNSTTCPICVSEFEQDDAIRMLPCDARHQFHKECVDPWLLNESRFCPLCRWDLSTRKDGSKIETEVILAESGEGEPDPISTLPVNQVPTESNNRRSSRMSSLPSWLSPRSSMNPSSGLDSSTPSSSFSIIPLIRRRRRDPVDQSGSIAHLHPSSSDIPVNSNFLTNPTTANNNNNNHNHNNHNHTTVTHQNNQEIIDSHNRFLRYIHQIRHLKK